MRQWESPNLNPTHIFLTRGLIVVVGRGGVRDTQHPRWFVHSARVILVVSDRVDAVVTGHPVQAKRRLRIESRVHGLHAHSPAGRPIPCVLLHPQAVSRARYRARLGHDACRAASSVCRAGERCCFLQRLVLLVAAVEDRTCDKGCDGGEDANDEPGYSTLAKATTSLVARIRYRGNGLNDDGTRARDGLDRGDGCFGG